jgi:hypothetical protein
MGERNRGQVLIMFVLALFLLVGFVALGIDVGYMYSVRNDLQRSADSGALAGAFAFHDGGWVSGSVPALLQTKAEARAKYFATRDPVGAAPLGNSAFLPFLYPAVNQIQVTVQKNVNLFFAGVLGSPTVMLSATATAEAIPVDQNVECLTPLAFPYPYVDTGNRGWDGEPFLPILQGLQVTFQVANTEPVSPPPPPILPPNIGNYVRYGLGGIGGAGEIFPIIMCGDSSVGESDLRLRIRTPCHDGCNAISIGDTVTLKGDPTYVPAIDEIQDEIINNDPSGFWPGGYPLPDSLDPNFSQANDLWMFSPRVVRVVLYDPQIARSTGAITVGAFAGFWIESVSPSPSWPNNADVTGYLVPDSAVGDTVGSPPLLIEPSLKTTRLVQ